MKKTIQVYILNNDSAYDGDFSHKTSLFADSAEAVTAYKKAVADAEESCQNDGGVRPIDLDGVDPDDYNNYDGAYVKEDTSSGTDEEPNYCTTVYMMGEYADDHIEVTLIRRPLEVEGKAFIGLTKENIHDKI